MRTCRSVAARFGFFDADSIAEGYLVLANVMSSYDSTRGASLKTFLITALRNCYMKHITKQRSRLPLIYLEDNKLACLAFSESNKYYEVQMFATELIDTLEEEDRRLLEMKFVKEISVEEIAKILKISESLVYKKVQQVLEKLNARYST